MEILNFVPLEVIHKVKVRFLNVNKLVSFVDKVQVHITKKFCENSKYIQTAPTEKEKLMLNKDIVRNLFFTDFVLIRKYQQIWRGETDLQS